jgi:hypothetical protein
METTLTALRTVKSIMDCTKDQFKSILLNHMCRFDDYQQIAFDQGKPEETIQYFVDAYNQLDAIFSICFRNNPGQPLSETVRNQSRMIIKYAERLACTELSQPGSAID